MSAFWDDLARDLEDPEFMHEYAVESVRSDTIGTILNYMHAATELLAEVERLRAVVTAVGALVAEAELMAQAPEVYDPSWQYKSPTVRAYRLSEALDKAAE